MSVNFLAKTVLEAAIDRLNFVFDECDDVILSMSGGKDSTVLYHLARTIAEERGRLPLKVFWLDQEAEWQATETYMRTVMYDAAVEPFWWQIPFRLTNSLSHTKAYLDCWRPEDRALWIREQDPLSIKGNPTRYDRFHDLVKWLPTWCGIGTRRHVGVLIGLRASENPVRFVRVAEHKAHYKGVVWCTKPIGNTRKFWPLYDWQDRDIWTAIAQGGGTGHGWPYNTVYDQFYRYGVPPLRMRVSALIHETAWTAIPRLQEIEPGLYDRVQRRVAGASCFSHFDRDIMPKTLPPAFADWQEYRDYLLEHLVAAENRALFRRRWARSTQQGERWHRIQVTELMVNDVDGTLTANAYKVFRLKDKKARFAAERAVRLERFLAASP